MLSRRGTAATLTLPNNRWCILLPAATMMWWMKQSFMNWLCPVTVSLGSPCRSQVARDRLGPADAVRDPAAADQSEELNWGRHPYNLWWAAEDSECAQECSAHGAGGQLWPQAEGEALIRVRRTEEGFYVRLRCSVSGLWTDVSDNWRFQFWNLAYKSGQDPFLSILSPIMRIISFL